MAPVILLKEDTVLHYLNEPYVDAGITVLDDKSCTIDTSDIKTTVNVDITRYGEYSVVYIAEDAADNRSRLTRSVDVILRPLNYFDETYSAMDSCTSGNYPYTGYIQDCDCGLNAVTVGNISNFGSSALFTLDLSGRYSEKILLDTTRLGVTFTGTGIMSKSADTLKWTYTISDSINSDFCTSVWLKND